MTNHNLSVQSASVPEPVSSVKSPKVVPVHSFQVNPHFLSTSIGVQDIQAIARSFTMGWVGLGGVMAFLGWQSRVGQNTINNMKI